VDLLVYLLASFFAGGGATTMDDGGTDPVNPECLDSKCGKP
jgi:hypothetical protein